MPGAFLRIDFEERDRHHCGVAAKEETLLWLQFPGLIAREGERWRIA
jgi:hypothetical protein